MAEQSLQAPVPRSRARNTIQRLVYDSTLWRRLVYLTIFGGAMMFIVGGSWVIGKTDLGIIVVGGVISIVAGAVMVVRPDIAMFILVGSVYTNSSDVLEVAFGIPSTNKLLVALTFVAVVGTRAIIQRRPLRFGATEIVIVQYAAIAIISLFSVGNIDAAMENIVDFAKDIAIVLILVQLCGDELTWKRMQWVLIVCAGILASMTVYQTLTGNYEFEFWGYAKAPVHEVVEGFDSARPTGPIDDPNYYSQLLLLVMPIALYRLLTEPTWRNKLIAGYFWLAIVATAVFSYSRGAFVTLVFIMGLVVLERRWNLVRVGIGVMVLIVVVTPMLPKGYTDRLATLTGVFEDTETQTEASFEGRTSEALAALMMFRDYPILGIGYGLYEENYLRYSIILGIDGRLEERQAHSLYLEVLAETGMVGVISFSAMLATFYFVSQKAVKDLRAVGRDDLVPWIRGIQLGFLSYSMTSIFLHDDWARFYRLGLAIVASSSVMADTVIANYKTQLAREQSNRKKSSIIVTESA